MKFLRALWNEAVPLPTSKDLLNPPALFDGYRDAVKEIEAGQPTDDDPKLLELSLKLFDNDEARRSSIDTRAGAMMSAITLAATLVTGVGFTAFSDTSKLSNGALWAMYSTFVLVLIYLTATGVLFFLIQGRVFRSTLDPKDLMLPPDAKPSRYPRQVAVKVLRYTINNYQVNNTVINRLWMAQKCFRNALLILVAGGLLTSTLLLIPSPGASSGLRLAQALARAAGCTDLPSLSIDRKGRWQGTCLLGVRSAHVFVDTDGRLSLSP